MIITATRMSSACAIIIKLAMRTRRGNNDFRSNDENSVDPEGQRSSDLRIQGPRSGVQGQGQGQGQGPGFWVHGQGSRVRVRVQSSGSTVRGPGSGSGSGSWSRVQGQGQGAGVGFPVPTRSWRGLTLLCALMRSGYIFAETLDPPLQDVGVVPIPVCVAKTRSPGERLQSNAVPARPPHLTG